MRRKLHGFWRTNLTALPFLSWINLLHTFEARIIFPLNFYFNMFHTWSSNRKYCVIKLWTDKWWQASCLTEGRTFFVYTHYINICNRGHWVQFKCQKRPPRLLAAFEGIIKVFIILRLFRSLFPQLKALSCLIYNTNVDLSFILHTKRNILIPQAHYVILFKVVSMSEVKNLRVN